MSNEYSGLENRIGYHFKDLAHLELAFTHSSVADNNNQRMEFLGDAVLDMVVADYLYRRYPQAHEGQLTTMRAQIVSRKPLCDLYEELQLSFHLQVFNLSKRNMSVKTRSDVVEALIAAIYLDGGVEPVRAFVERFICAAYHERVDYKSRMYEYAQSRGLHVLFETIDVGDEHKPFFESTLMIDGTVYGPGRGNSKKQAEQAASRVAWEVLCIN